MLGVDGCRGGWIGALVEGDRFEWQLFPDAASVLAMDADVTAIDIPIGLPDAGTRACDVEARRALGSRRSSVFAAPVRAVLGCATYAEARTLLAARGGPSMSAQAFGIVRAVRDVDAALSPTDADRVIEVHPELAFRLLAGVELASKKTAVGRDQRVAALSTPWPDVPSRLNDAPRAAAPDDALDALACAWVAQRWLRGEATVLGDGSRDPRGLTMRIVT